MSIKKSAYNFTGIIVIFTIALITILNIIMAQSESNELGRFRPDMLKIDIRQSKIEWIGRKVTGEHSGTLDLSEGWVEMDGSTLIGGKFIIDMKSIKNVDIETPTLRLKLENHLKSADFFNVDSFPQVILDIKKNHSIVQDVKSDSKKMIYADLTIRGITNKIILSYELGQSANHFIATGSVDIDRTLYNIKYKSGNYFMDLGDKIIYDDFTIIFKVHTIPI